MHQFLKYERKITCRTQFGTYVREKLGLTDVAVEIGVHKGIFALKFMRSWQGKKFYLVDPYRKLPKEEYNDMINRNFDPNREGKTRRLMTQFGDRVKFMKMRSEEAAPLIDGPLDFVHIDGNHSYQHCRMDIDLWWPKVRSGGMLAGHDIFQPAIMGVTQAVLEFSMESGLTVNVVPFSTDANRKPISAPSWWVVKP